MLTLDVILNNLCKKFYTLVNISWRSDPNRNVGLQKYLDKYVVKDEKIKLFIVECSYQFVDFNYLIVDLVSNNVQNNP